MANIENVHFYDFRIGIGDHVILIIYQYHIVSRNDRNFVPFIIIYHLDKAPLISM